MSPARLRIAVAIPTYRRPHRLERLLDALPERLAEVPDADAHVFVIDNDPARSAAEVASVGRAGLSIMYAPEPRPGIAAARQHALDVSVDHDVLVFIDDDEIPRPGWLSSLVAAWQRTGASAVAGHVHTVFPVDADPWVIASGLFARPMRREDEPLPAAGAGNLLLDLDMIKAAGLRFEPSLGLFGGEDTLFTRQIVQAGGKIIACPASVADDELEPGRATRHFALARARHHGQTQVVVELLLAKSLPARVLTRARNSVKGLAWCARGLVKIVVGARSLERRAFGIRQLHRGLGLLQGSLGIVRPAYERPDAPHRHWLRRSASRMIRAMSPFFTSVTAIRTDEPVVVLTLDDGPDPDWTPRILEVLAARGARATFFVLLTRTRSHPELLRRILDEGHEIALHGADHRHLSSIPVEEVDALLRDGRREIESLTGHPIRWYRPPYGGLSPRTWRAVRSAGMVPVLWTTSVLDGGDAPHTERLRKATHGIRRGAIVLAHDSRANEADGVDDPEIEPFDRAALIADVVDAYTERGLRTVSLREALETGRTARSMVLVGGRK